MKTTSGWMSGIAATVFAGTVTAMPVHAQQVGTQIVQIGNTDIGGTVTGANGPEAGVWVIAETADLPTKYAKIVVTNASGQYLIPDLPDAK